MNRLPSPFFYREIVKKLGCKPSVSSVDFYAVHKLKKGWSSNLPIEWSIEIIGKKAGVRR